MEEHLESPDYIFEISWEICNKVGGIHTVLSTKALTMVNEWDQHYIMIGPDIWKGNGEHPEFAEDKNLLSGWRHHANLLGLKIKTGRWKITGSPIVILVDFTPFYTKRDEIFRDIWLTCKVDSISGQWDYVEPALFGYAAAKVIECFYHYHLTFSDKIVAHFHEWLTGIGVHYLEEHVPQIGTIFTTHATTVGRSIAGNGLPLYSKFSSYHGDQEAKNFNVIAKHSLEKTTAAHADCFSTVSEITARECKQFLDKEPDIITPNGFEDFIVPDTLFFKEKRILARKKLLTIAGALTGQTYPDDTLLMLKSGRYEFHNKGIDISIDALGKLNKEAGFNKDIIAFIFIPANQTGPRKDLLDHIGNNNPSAELKGDKVLTHYLQGADSDPILNRIKQNELYNNKENKVKIVFAPVYLDGKDGIFNIPYYDLLVGFDISAFPSYYEPWGYTPLESIAFHIPTITTNVTGFGIMLHSNDLNIGKGMSVIERTDTNDQEAADKIKSVVQEFSQKTPAEIESAREAASQLSKTALWKNYIINYKKAYDIALKKTEGRAKTFVHEGGIPFHKLETTELNKVSIPIWRELFVQSELPESLKTLNKLARNLWWTWNTEAQELFEACDKELWKSCDNNPIILLESLSYNKLQKLEKDKEFIERVNSVDKLFEEYMNRPFNKTPKVVYFCMEYGIYKHLKIYSGGLGILAGDYLKQASDSATNITGIGLLYKEGYFKQVISAHNEQMELEDTNTLTNLPIEHVYDANGNWLRISLAFPGRTLYAKVWKVNVGKVSLYLLDTDIPQNQAEDRLITARLYGGDTENRLKQELLLGIGGVRLMHKLDLKPEVYHYNEGHAAFAGLERLVTLVQGFNLSFDEAMEIVRASSLFTTHTAVPAGHDRFTEDILRVYLSFHANLLNISWKQLMGLGRANENDPAEKFSMSFLAARLSQDVNAVSKIHERVSKKLFRSLWESYSEEEINIGHVTNGVHYSSWVGSPWDKLYKGIFNDAQVSEQSHDSWKRINDISDAKIWEAHLECKKALLEEIKRRLKYEMNGLTGVKNAVQEKDILNEKTLIVGFARRFVTYKRPALLFNDLNRLADILQDKEKPVLFLYAGKSHPADKEAQELMKYVIEISKNARFEGHILYLQNYNTDLAKYLTQGVDLWLNTPEQDTEASGTSGMKAALNGVLNFSVLDGWWAEAYNEDIGWAIHSVQETNESHGANNVTDADELYQVLQHSIIPDFFAKEKDDYPEKWVNRMKKSIALIVPQFSMKRMLDEYTEKYYKKLSEKSTQIASNEWEGARKLTAWKNNVKAKWENLKVKNLEVFDSADRTLPLGTELTPRLTLDIQDFSADDISVEVVFTQKRNSNEEFGKIVLKKELVPASTKDNIVVYECKVPITKSGNFEYGFRISPKNNLLSYPHDFPLLKWV